MSEPTSLADELEATVARVDALVDRVKSLRDWRVRKRLTKTKRAQLAAVHEALQHLDAEIRAVLREPDAEVLDAQRELERFQRLTGAT